jgi:hypothetical protein
MENHPRHPRRTLSQDTTPAVTAGGEPVAASPGQASGASARDPRAGRGRKGPDIFGQVEDSTVSAWSVILSRSLNSDEVMAVAGC